MMSKSDDLLCLAVGIALSAGKEILQVYERAEAVEVTLKDDDSPLTEADQRSNQLIVSELGKVTPDIPILSEEIDQADYSSRKEWTRYWLIDPLDGTKEFVKRNGEFTVNIALIEQGRPVIGVVHVPVTGVTYKGIVGQGAWRHSGDGNEVPISCRPMHAKAPVLKVVASRSHGSTRLDDLLQSLEKQFSPIELVSMGSSLKICLVAEGAADLYPRLGPTCEWDTAAAHAVLAAAGGCLVDTEFNELQYNKKDLLNPFFIAIADRQFQWQNIITGALSGSE